MPFTVGLLVAYTGAMFILYTVAPILYRMYSSAYYNISLLTSDFYGLLFGLFLFVRFFPIFPPLFELMVLDLQHYRVYWLYFVAFAVVIGGLIIYFWSATRTFLFPCAS